MCRKMKYPAGLECTRHVDTPSCCLCYADLLALRLLLPGAGKQQVSTVLVVHVPTGTLLRGPLPSTELSSLNSHALVVQQDNKTVVYPF
jgi:hypothetical protein